MKRFFAIVAVLIGALAYAGVAQAATATLFGTAVVEGDHVKIVSDFSDVPWRTAREISAANEQTERIIAEDAAASAEADER